MGGQIRPYRHTPQMHASFVVFSSDSRFGVDSGVASVVWVSVIALSVVWLSTVELLTVGLSTVELLTVGSLIVELLIVGLSLA